MALNKKFVAFHAINDVILNVYCSKLFVSSQIIHIGLTKKTSRLLRDSRNSEICFWALFLRTTRSDDFAFLAAIPASELFSLEASIFSAEQLQHKRDILL